MLVLPDHAQLKTGTLLNGIVTLFQITDFSIEARIPDFQFLGYFFLLLQLKANLQQEQTLPDTRVISARLSKA